MHARKSTLSSGEKRSSDLRWCHPLVRFADFLAGIGFWITHVVVAVGVIALLVMEWSGLQIDGAWRVVAAVATLVVGVAVLFSFAGWIARSGRDSQ